jgi:hypothetical protein
VLEAIRPYWALIRAALVLAVLAAAFVWGYESNHSADKVQAAWDHAEKVASEVRQKRVEAARQKEVDLQEAAETDRRKASEENQRLADRVAGLVRSLRQRPLRPEPPRPGDVHPQPSGPPAENHGCTGADLYRDDGELLTRYAALAAAIKSERDQCYIQYERAQEALKNQGNLTP